MNKYLSIFAAVLALLSISVTRSYASTVFTDSFTDTNGTDLTTHDSNWDHTHDAGVGTIESNQVDITGGANSGYSYDGISQQDGCVSMDLDTSTANFTDLSVRNDDSGTAATTLQFWFDSATTGHAELFTQAGGDEGSFSFTGLADENVHNMMLCETGTNIAWYVDNAPQGTFTDPSTPSTGKLGFYGETGAHLDNFAIYDSDPNTAGAVISASPSTSTVSVGTPFNVAVVVNGGSQEFNAAQATVAISSNLSVTGIHNATSNSCGFQYTKHPTPSDPSFAGGIFGGSSTSCTAYVMTLTPTATGTGTVTLTNGSIKAYSDSSEILTGVVNGSFTISDGPTPTPTFGVPQLTVTSPLETYYIGDTYTLAGGKDSSITHVFVNGSESGVTFPTSTTWQVSESLAALGTGNVPSDNYFTIYGSDGTSSTASQTVDVSRHLLGDINGDGVVDLTDASLFAVDYGKTSGLTYVLSDMNGDGNANLTDLSILAKLED